MRGKRITTKLDTHTFIQVSVGLLIVLCLVDDSFGRLKCKKGFRYVEDVNKSAICEKCDCRAGFEWDTSVKLNRQKWIGFTECYPCVPCPDGKYRVANSLTNKCSKCQRNCTNENKFVAEPCGGTTAGYCGNCFPRYKMDSIDHNSRCVPDKTGQIGCAAGLYHDGERCVSCSLNCSAQHRKMAEKCGGVSAGRCGTCQPGFSETASEKCLPENPDTNFEIHSENHKDQEHFTYMTPIVGAAALVAGVCLFLIGYFAIKKWKRRTTNMSNRSYKDAQDCGQSAHKLLNSGTTLGGDYKDIETDGPPKGVRGELPLPVSLDTQLIGIPEWLSGTRFDLEMNSLVANNISGDDQVLRFFDAFPIKKTFIDPERDFWMYGKHTFYDYVFNVLKRWMEVMGKNATLDKVCDALNDADFNHVVPMLIQHVTIVRPELSSNVSHLSTADLYNEFHLAGCNREAVKTGMDKTPGADLLPETNDAVGKNDHAKDGDYFVLMKKGFGKEDSVDQGEIAIIRKQENEDVDLIENAKHAEQGTANKEHLEPSECALLMEQDTSEEDNTELSEFVLLMEQCPTEERDTELSECTILMETDRCYEEQADSSEHTPC